MFERIDSGEVEITGTDGLLPALLKEALERGLAAELTDHLGYERGESAPSARPNTRNGTTAKTVDSEVGPFEIEVPTVPGGLVHPALGAQGTAPTRRPGFDDHQLVRRGHDGARHPPPPGVHDRCGPERGNDLQDHRRGAPGAVQRAAQAFGGLLPRDLPRRDPRPWPRADHQVSSHAAHIAVGAAVDGLLSTCWASGSKPMKGPPSGPTCAPNWPTGACKTC